MQLVFDSLRFLALQGRYSSSGAVVRRRAASLDPWLDAGVDELDKGLSLVFVVKVFAEPFEHNIARTVPIIAKEAARLRLDPR